MVELHQANLEHLISPVPSVWIPASCSLVVQQSTLRSGTTGRRLDVKPAVFGRTLLFFLRNRHQKAFIHTHRLCCI